MTRYICLGALTLANLYKILMLECSGKTCLENNQTQITTIPWCKTIVPNVKLPEQGCEVVMSDA